MEQHLETISVIIPTHRRSDKLNLLLRSIYEQNFDKESYQVLVVSNLKDHKTQKVYKSWEDKFYDLKYFEVGLKGVNLARNMGIRFSGCDVLYFIDDDCVIDNKNHFRHLLDLHNSKPNLTGIGGGYVVRSSCIRPHQWIYVKGQEHWMNRVFNESNSLQLIGGNASYKSIVFRKGFVFDSEIIFGGSEIGFNNELRSFGYKLGSFSSLNVSHLVSDSVYSFLKKSFQQGQGYWVNLVNESGAESTEKDLLETHKFIFPKNGREILDEAKGLQRLYWYLYHLFFKFGFWWKSGGDKNIAPRWFLLLKLFLGQTVFKKLNNVFRKLNNAFVILVLRLCARLRGSKLMKPYYFCEYQFKKRVLKSE